MIGLLVDQPPLRGVQIAAECGQVGRLRHRQRIADEIDLIAHRRGLELIEPLEAFERLDRLQRPIEQEAHQLHVIGAQLAALVGDGRLGAKRRMLQIEVRRAPARGVMHMSCEMNAKAATASAATPNSTATAA